MALPVSSQQPHIAVLENDAQEDLLPIEYRNPFLKTPRVRALLDRSSWFGPGENQVRHSHIAHIGSPPFKNSIITVVFYR